MVQIAPRWLPRLPGRHTRSHLGGGLWIGSFPPPGWELREAGFDVLVLCAEELEPLARDADYPGVRVIRAGIDDGVLSEREARVVLAAGGEVARELRRGHKVICTCAQGKNRSALVCCVAMRLAYGLRGPECVERVRARREGAFSNPHFVRALGAA